MAICVNFAAGCLETLGNQWQNVSCGAAKSWYDLQSAPVGHLGNLPTDARGHSKPPLLAFVNRRPQVFLPPGTDCFAPMNGGIASARS